MKENTYQYIIDLMAKICSAQPSTDLRLFWDIVDKAYHKKLQSNNMSLSDYVKEYRASFWNFDFYYILKRLCEKIALGLTVHQNTYHTQVVVAGGFDSGKSSFLNKLVKSVDLLPTGVEPVSVVKTYLYCSKEIRQITAKGINLKNVLVSLPVDVLKAIQHGSESNIYLASVLEKLFVEIPSQELDGIVFIDTPGYNNTDKVNAFNGKSDKRTALEALKEGNVLFWMVDCESGAIMSDDMDVIKTFKGPKVFIFNKADIVGETNAKGIIEEAAQTLYKEFPKEDIIDILAYSTLDEKVYYSMNMMTLDKIIDFVRCFGKGINEQERLLGAIGDLFDKEILESQKIVADITENYQKFLEIKNHKHDVYYKMVQEQQSLKEFFRDILLIHYGNMADREQKLKECLIKTLQDFKDLIADIDLHNEARLFSTSSDIRSALKRGLAELKGAVQVFRSLPTAKTWDENIRKDLLKRIDEAEKEMVEKYKEEYEMACNETYDILDKKQTKEAMTKHIAEYKEVMKSALNVAIQKYKENNKAVDIGYEDEMKTTDGDAEMQDSDNNDDFII